MNKYVFIINGQISYAISDDKYEVGEWILVSKEDENLVAQISNVKEKKKDEKILNQILRPATTEEIESFKKQQAFLINVAAECQHFATQLKLPMKILDVFENSKENTYVVNFYADNRVDFRELAKKISSKYRKRIELHQIGARDKAKKVGGLGPCGLILCCNKHLVNFASISINMAKNQMLALNPSKINGQCGRLLCCLNYEDETYTYLKASLPKLGEEIKNQEINGRVIEVNVLKSKYTVLTEKKERVECVVDAKGSK